MTSVAPAANAMVNQLWPPWCSSGHWMSATLSGSSPMPLESMMASSSTRSAPWVRAAPFGRPVEPPVYWMRDKASASRNSGGSAVPRPAHARSKSSAPGTSPPALASATSDVNDCAASATDAANWLANTSTSAPLAFTR